MLVCPVLFLPYDFVPHCREKTEIAATAHSSPSYLTSVPMADEDLFSNGSDVDSHSEHSSLAPTNTSHRHGSKSANHTSSDPDSDPDTSSDSGSDSDSSSSRSSESNPQESALGSKKKRQHLGRDDQGLHNALEGALSELTEAKGGKTAHAL